MDYLVTSRYRHEVRRGLRDKLVRVPAGGSVTIGEDRLAFVAGDPLLTVTPLDPGGADPGEEVDGEEVDGEEVDGEEVDGQGDSAPPPPKTKAKGWGRPPAGSQPQP